MDKYTQDKTAQFISLSLILLTHWSLEDVAVILKV